MHPGQTAHVHPSRCAHALRVGLTAVVLLGLGLCGCGESDHPSPPGFTASPGDVEAIWLQRIGVGREQTARACALGAADPVARALCKSPPPALKGLADLYRLLEITPGVDGDVAVTTHSLGLSARTVSAVNPRTIVFRKYARLTPTQTSAVAFARGQPLAELMGYDPVANAFRFYLLAFRPRCGQSDSQGADGPCTASDLLSERIESGWLDWTLYAERDLEDTALNCTSCHRPDGAQTPSRLLMRQLESPWLHWGDFRGVKSPLLCPDGNGNETLVDGEIDADGADSLSQLNGADGRQGAIPVAQLIAATSGYDLSSFLFYAAGYADGPGDVPCVPPHCAISEPHPFPANQVLCDRLQQGRADVAGGAWQAYRAQQLPRGFPVPYFEPELLEPARRSALAGSFGAFLAEPSGTGDSFSKLSALVNEDVTRAIGFLPDLDDSGSDILTKMCVRCHAGNVDPALAPGRSRFNATALDRLTAAEATTILERLHLPRTSPARMPPLLAGELPDWAVQRVTEFLSR